MPHKIDISKIIKNTDFSSIFLQSEISILMRKPLENMTVIIPNKCDELIEKKASDIKKENNAKIK